MADKTTNPTSKVLSINFGSYICELEGFANPFKIIRNVVDYFGELAEASPDENVFDLKPDVDHLQRLLIDSAGDPYVRIVEFEGGVRMRTLQDSSNAPEDTPAETDAKQAEDAPAKEEEVAAVPEEEIAAAPEEVEEVVTKDDVEVPETAKGEDDVAVLAEEIEDEDLDVEDLAAMMADELADVDESDLSLEGLGEEPEVADAPEAIDEEPAVEEPAEISAEAEAAPEASEQAQEPETQEPEQEEPAEEPMVLEAKEDAPVEEPMELEAELDTPVEEPTVLDADQDEPAEEPMVLEAGQDEPVEEPTVLEADQDEPVEEPMVLEAGQDEPVEEPMVLEAGQDAPAEEPMVLDAGQDAPAEEPMVLEAGQDEPVEEPMVLDAGQDEPVEEPMVLDAAQDEPALEPLIVDRETGLEAPLPDDEPLTAPDLVADGLSALDAPVLEEPAVEEAEEPVVNLRLSDAEIAENAASSPLQLTPQDVSEEDDSEDTSISLRVLSNDEAEDEPLSLRNDAPKRSLRIIRTDAEEEPISGEETGAVASSENDSELSAFARQMGAASLPELLEASAAFVTLVDNQQQFSRKTILQMVDDISDEKNYTAEARIKSFGKLLRAGKIMRVEGGQFAISQATRFSYESRM